ncbi:MAG: family 20 glycosylhydrolase, partial [Armatimonadetes bacterium]|nr:family 20 glycosylhydrolase [Armatimonadota bacterium]
IVLPAGASADDHFAAGDLAAVIAERTNLTLVVTAGEPQPGDIALKQVKEPLASGPEAYRVVVGEHIEAVAADAAGLFYAACTIGQLTGPGGALPRVTIEDWPAYPLRGLQYDVARGQTVETGWWEKLIRELARCKLNAIMVYGENDYAFRGFPFLGRAGTFTPEKAQHLADFARRYHVQLIPQFEALGHASAVLSSKELEPLREAGGPWVYCTSKQATWDFLDRIFAELVEQFPDSRYLHVGADEFEMAFGKCPDCAAKVARVGLGGLYAEHMNKLNALGRKHGRKMLFWPSHAGPSDDLSYMTIANAASLQRDCIPTEWIYHGPTSYPEIARYQDLGFEDVWVSPAVVCFSVIWPDYPTTYRGIRGFLRAGDARGSRGAMTTTWEWMHGALAANSLLGMVYAAECAWSLGQTTTADFERRFAGWYFGVDDPAGESLHQALAVPWPDGASGALLRNQRLLTELAWAAPATVRRLVIKQPQLHDVAPSLAAVEQAIARVDALQQRAVRNAALLD